MSKPNKFIATLLATALISAPTLAANANAPFITVNGFPIPQYVVDAFVNEQKSRGIADGPELRAAVREEMLRRALIASEAKKKGLEKRAEVKGQIEIASQLILIRTYVGDYVRNNPVTDAELKQAYDELVAKLGNTEYKVRHILVEKEETARNLIARLEKGEKFEDLAKESQDPGSKETGGDLGWNTPAAYVEPFGAALTQLEKGKYTQTPVQTRFGYHVILLEDTRDLTPPTLDDLKPQLTQNITQQKVEKMIEGLKAKARIK
ncbi:MAG: peptidylprolyl isomerase [Zoogloeaceae bacterium]|jgi:peptidyl-prolyl cis-trans isomerase C|nr:peptidylprolyl isomerase [Zoogloeaceae bacterium]